MKMRHGHYEKGKQSREEKRNERLPPREKEKEKRRRRERKRKEEDGGRDGLGHGYYIAREMLPLATSTVQPCPELAKPHQQQPTASIVSLIRQTVSRPRERPPTHTKYDGKSSHAPDAATILPYMGYLLEDRHWTPATPPSDTGPSDGCAGQRRPEGGV